MGAVLAPPAPLTFLQPPRLFGNVDSLSHPLFEHLFELAGGPPGTLTHRSLDGLAIIAPILITLPDSGNEWRWLL